MFAGPNIPASTYRDRTARNAVADDAREGVSPSNAELAEAAGQADRARHESGDGALRPVRATGDEAGEPSQRALRIADGPAPVRAELARSGQVKALTFEVLGKPAPKGSSRAAMFGGRAHIIPNSSTANATAQRAWVKAVRSAATIAAEVAGVGLVFWNTALHVAIAFHVERPKSVKLSKRPMPSTRPDVDKTARCTIDALTGILWVDDSRICDLVLSKRWAAPGREGASISVQEAR